MVGSALTSPARLTNELPVFQLAAKSLRPPLPSTMRTSMELRAATAKGPGGVAVKDSRGMSGTLMLVLTFIASAVANRVANRVLLVPMAGHTLFLSLATSTAQLTAYLLLLAWRAWKQLAISDMCQFVAAHWKLLLLVGTCEGAFYPLVFAAAAKLPGGLVQVLNQSVVPYTVAFSVFLLGRRYTPVQLVGVATVLLGVLVAVGLPAGSLWSHQVVMHDVLQCAGAYALLALAVTLKDRIFRNARETATTAVEEPQILLVSAVGAAVQLLVQLVAFPLAFPGHVHPDVLREGLNELMGRKLSSVPWIAFTYWVCNIIFSVSALRLVRRASASTVVLANVAALPLSALVFCCPLPLLKPQQFRWTFAMSLLLVAGGNLLYGRSSPKPSRTK